MFCHINNLEVRYMTWIEILALAAALAMDAFSVSVSSGMSGSCTIKNAAKMALMFGAFQFLMPLIGNGAALFFVDYTKKFTPFIVFAILTFLGVRMIFDTFGGKSELPRNPFKFSSLCLLAFATSVDALAAGISIGASGAPVFSTSVIIGMVAAVFSAAGLYIGKSAKNLLPFPAEIIGGVILIIIAVKSLISAFI